MMSCNLGTTCTVAAVGAVRVWVTDGEVIITTISSADWYGNETCATETMDLGAWDTMPVRAPKIQYLSPPEQWYPQWQPKWRPAASQTITRPSRAQARACRKQSARWKRRRFIQRLKKATHGQA